MMKNEKHPTKITPQNNSYEEKLSEAVVNFRLAKSRPSTDLKTINKKLTRFGDKFVPLFSDVLHLMRYISPFAKCVHIELITLHLDYGANQNGLITISQQKLAELCGICKDTVINAIDELEKIGLIRVHRAVRNSGQTNAYLLTSLPDCLGCKAVRDYEKTGILESAPSCKKIFGNDFIEVLQHIIQVRSQLNAGDDIKKHLRQLERVSKRSKCFTEKSAGEKKGKTVDNRG